uniref:Uncharacterized protein n=1 Tax=Arion vulgaris TaxID=1028688 RepID=A0A0B7BAR7_9EUPU
MNWCLVHFKQQATHKLFRFKIKVSLTNHDWDNPREDLSPPAPVAPKLEPADPGVALVRDTDTELLFLALILDREPSAESARSSASSNSF